MKASVQDMCGSAAVLQTRAIDKPEIGDDEVLVHVRAAGVNPADWAIMGGLPYIARPAYGLRGHRTVSWGRTWRGRSGPPAPW